MHTRVPGPRPPNPVIKCMPPKFERSVHAGEQAETHQYLSVVRLPVRIQAPMTDLGLFDDESLHDSCEKASFTRLNLAEVRKPRG